MWGASSPTYNNTPRKTSAKPPVKAKPEPNQNFLATLEGRGGEGRFWLKNVLERCGVRAQTFGEDVIPGTIVDAVLRIAWGDGTGWDACMHPGLA